MDLQDFRKLIDTTDDKLIELFTERMEISRQIAMYKFKNDLAVFDSSREKEKLEDVGKKAGDVLGAYAQALYNTIFELSRDYQEKTLEDIRGMENVYTPDGDEAQQRRLPNSGLPNSGLPYNEQSNSGQPNSGARSDMVFGLLGETLGHSFSQKIHKQLGDYDYFLFEIRPDDLDEFMTKKPFDGINVTIPYKQSVMPYCTVLSKEAQEIGSVNTIIKDENGVLIGYNTDYHGFKLLLSTNEIDPLGKKVLVLGDGGSARTVRAVLRELGTGEIVTISRRGENHYGNIDRHYDADIIVNTTPVGMSPDNGSKLISLKEFRKLSGIVDLIYNPLRTALLLEAEELRIPCANGLLMLVAQAEYASRLFMGQIVDGEDVSDSSSLTMEKGKELSKADVDTVYDAMLLSSQNIAIIGMPGSGKSTVGKMLANLMERPFVDLDDEIADIAGKTIPEIFSDDGEETFRQLETKTLSEASSKNGIVIATGGGIVTRPENYGLLRQNNIIVYLKRDIASLETQGRPLSLSEGIESLAKQRIPIYEAWSDVTVDVEETAQATSKVINEICNGNGTGISIGNASDSGNGSSGGSGSASGYGGRNENTGY